MAFIPAPVRRSGTAVANVVTTSAERTEQLVDTLGNFIGAAHAYSEGMEQSVRDNEVQRSVHRKVSAARDDARFFKEVRDEFAGDKELEDLFWQALEGYELEDKVRSKLQPST